MRITKKIDSLVVETTVDIVAKTATEMNELIYALESIDNCIVGILAGKAYRIKFSDILYFESVDKKTFAYTCNSVYELTKKLYEIEGIMPHEFMRTEKSSIVNLARVDCFKRETFGRTVAQMENGEKVMISRMYVSDLKEKLNGGKL